MFRSLFLYVSCRRSEVPEVPVSPLKIQSKIVAIMDKALKEKREKEKKAENLLNSIDNYLMQELGIASPEFEEKTH